jgi:hypothetical protein
MSPLVIILLLILIFGTPGGLALGLGWYSGILPLIIVIILIYLLLNRPYNDIP